MCFIAKRFSPLTLKLFHQNRLDHWKIYPNCLLLNETPLKNLQRMKEKIVHEPTIKPLLDQYIDSPLHCVPCCKNYLFFATPTYLPTYPVCFQMLPIHEQGYLGSCDFVTHFSKNASKHSVQKQDLIYATFHFGNLLFTLPNKCVDHVEGRHEQR